MTTKTWTCLFLMASAGVTVGCGGQIICESGANCASGGGGSGASGGTGGTGGTVGTAATAGTGGIGGTGGVGPGGGPAVDLTDVCDDLCACDPTLCDGSLQECYASVDDYVDTALAAGCHQEIAALDVCLDQTTCVGNDLEFPPCMDATQAAVEDCIGGNPTDPQTICDEAAVICGGSPEPGTCAGEVVCYASCVVSLDTCDVDDPELTSCFDGCM